MKDTLSHIVVYLDRLLKSSSIVWICCSAVVYADTIQNSAILHYQYNATDFQVQSNTVQDTIVDSNGTNPLFALSCRLTQALEVSQGAQRAALPFLIENKQNTPLTLSLIMDANTTYPVDNPGLFSDTNANGTYDSGDTVATSVTLAAGASQVLFFVSDIPSDASWSFSANGMTAGSSATTPPTTSSAQCLYTLQSHEIDPDKRLKVLKSASYSSDQLYKGSVIYYTIRIEAVEAGLIQNPTFVDTIPAGTSFVPGSVTLDGSSKPDSQVFDGSTVTVTMPDMSQGETHTVTFEVKVNK